MFVECQWHGWQSLQGRLAIGWREGASQFPALSSLGRRGGEGNSRWSEGGSGTAPVGVRCQISWLEIRPRIVPGHGNDEVGI